jgi:uncharacterized protein YbjT (DUF2867 family)/tryptophan-rich sensory protein
MQAATSTATQAAAAHRGERTALVTGSTGYIGGLLVPRLLDQGWTVRVLTRRRSSLEEAPWRDAVEVVEGDASSADDLRTALHGIRVAYFLIHSMGDAADFAEHDRRLAQTFAAAAREAGVGRIVYLSGLHPSGEELSPHLASRVEVGEILLASGVPTAVLQAAVVLGDGSASFDMLRYLASRLPAMVAPKWLHNRIQPIAIDDVMHYLVGAADLPGDVNRTFDIGGPQVMTYEDMLHGFVRVTGRRKRPIVTVPVLTPRLASHWVGLVTPLDAGIAKPLVGSLVHEVVCEEQDIVRYVPDPERGLMDFDDAVRLAMRHATPDTGPRNLAILGAATVTSAVLGGLATQPASRWYRRLDLPSWQPPAAAFPIVWTALYADIAATSAATVTGLEREGRHDEARAYRRALAANLALNTGWSWLFWRVRRLDVAAVEAALLAASSADLARRAGVESQRRGALLAPYAVWTGFAAVLSAAIARRNRR